MTAVQDKLYQVLKRLLVCIRDNTIYIKTNTMMRCLLWMLFNTSATVIIILIIIIISTMNSSTASHVPMKYSILGFWGYI